VVEATDNLGLVGKSAEASVSIIVPSTAQGMFVAVSQKKPVLLVVAAIVTVSFVLLALVVGGRIRPKPHPGQARPGSNGAEKTRPAGSRAQLVQPGEAINQPNNSLSTPAVSERIHLKGWFERLPWFKHEETLIAARAHLIPLVGFDEPTIPAPFQITSDNIRLGSDTRQADFVIADPSIEGLHTRIQFDGNTFLITDAGTVAGTWVNYEQATSQGTQLRHMDIIHLGRIGFRFQLSEPGQLRKISVTPLEPKF
jgi:hypothetical protein